MKKILLLSIFFALIAFSCKKEEGCETCQAQNEFVTTQLLVNNESQMALSVKNQNPEIARFSFISKTEDRYITQTMRALLISYGIGTQSGEPVALTLYFGSLLTNTKNLNGISPIALIVYTSISNRTFASFYQRGTDNLFYKDVKLSGISTFVSPSDMYNVLVPTKLPAREILLLINQARIPSKPYPTDFQSKIELASKLVPGGGGGGGGGTSHCNSSPECKDSQEGWCYAQEKQNGPTSYACFPLGDIKGCLNMSAERVLNSNGYQTIPTVSTSLYQVRDNFLANSVKGMYYIDDYYYLSNILKKNQITFSFALSAYKLYRTDFLHRLTQITNPNYSNSIAITPNDKRLLLDLCAKTGELSRDVRYQAIVNSVRNDVNKYAGKTFGEVRRDF